MFKQVAASIQYVSQIGFVVAKTNTKFICKMKFPIHISRNQGSAYFYVIIFWIMHKTEN